MWKGYKTCAAVEQQDFFSIFRKNSCLQVKRSHLSNNNNNKAGIIMVQNVGLATDSLTGRRLCPDRHTGEFLY